MDKKQKNTAIYIAYDEFNPFDPAAPEKSLLLAILMTAINDLRRTGAVSQAAADFFLSTDEHYIFSFQSICNHLDIDPKRVLRLAGLLPGGISEYEQKPSPVEQHKLECMKRVRDVLSEQKEAP